VSSTTGRELVLKVALGPDDFPTDVRASKDLLRACAAAATEQGALLASANLPFVPKLEAQLLVESRPALLLHRYSSSLQRRLDAGMPLADALRLGARVTAQLHAGRRVHGNLRPTNILLDERGEPVLSDLATPATRDVSERLEAIASDRLRYRPPEALAEPRPGWDTWALCQILYAAAMLQGPVDDASPQRALCIPTAGIDKVEVATLKDRAIARLSAESANGRFRSRLTEKLGAVLNRGLSPMADPSPPYRFNNAAALLPRIEEITALLMPTVTDVGRILLGGAADQGQFQGESPVTFATSVACSAGITQHEDIVCGLQIVDIDAEDGGRIPVHDASFKVSTHPSGRLRYQFSIPNLPPGRYRLKMAFSIRDSDQEPATAHGSFEVRPQPGYVPPAADAPSGPVPIAEIKPTTATPGTHPGTSVDDVWASDPGSEVDAEAYSDPGAEVIEGFFPRPIAPPEEIQQDVVPVIAEVVNESAAAQAEVLTPPLAMPVPAAMQASNHFSSAGPAPSTPSMNAPLPPPMVIPKISIGAPMATVPPPPHTSAQTGLSWAALSATLGGSNDHFAIEADRLLPGAQSEGSDLPFWDESGFGAKARSIPGFDQILAMIRRDSYTAFVAAAALSFVLLLVMMALLKAF